MGFSLNLRRVGLGVSPSVIGDPAIGEDQQSQVRDCFVVASLLLAMTKNQYNPLTHRGGQQVFIHFTPTGAATCEFRYDRGRCCGRRSVRAEHQWVNENDEIVIAAAARREGARAPHAAPDTIARRTALRGAGRQTGLRPAVAASPARYGHVPVRA